MIVFFTCLAAFLGACIPAFVNLYAANTSKVNAVRDDLASFFSEITSDEVELIAAKDVDLSAAQRSRSGAKMAYFRILLRLDLTKYRERQLALRLETLLTLGVLHIGNDNVESAIVIARELLDEMSGRSLATAFKGVLRKLAKPNNGEA